MLIGLQSCDPPGSLGLGNIMPGVVKIVNFFFFWDCIFSRKLSPVRGVTTLMSKCGSSGSCLGSSLSRLTMSLSTLSYCPLTATESPWILVVMRLGTGRIGGSIFVGGSLVFHSHTSSVTFYKLSAPTIIMVQTCNRCGNFRRSWFLLWNSHVDWGRWQLVTCQSCCAAQLSSGHIPTWPLPHFRSVLVVYKLRDVLKSGTIRNSEAKYDRHEHWN